MCDITQISESNYAICRNFCGVAMERRKRIAIIVLLLTLLIFIILIGIKISF